MEQLLPILTIALLIAAVVLLILLYIKKPDHSAVGTLETKLSLLEQQLTLTARQTTEALSQLRAESGTLQKEMRQETGTALKEMTGQMNRLATSNLEQQQKMTHTVAASMAEMTERMSALQKSNLEQQNRMSEAVTTAIHRMQAESRESSERQAKTVETAITKMQENNEKKLDQMRQTVDEKLTSTLTTRLDSSFKTVSQQLENVYKSLGEMKELSAGVTDNVTSLNRVLTNVKARGTWAEVQLESLLDQTIPGMYEKNVATRKGSLERVEFAIKIPSNDEDTPYTYLPVDSKFPMEDYVRLTDAADRADAPALEAARKALENRVKEEAKAVAGYIHVPGTTPFAIMYLATEGLYAEISASRTGLPEKIQRDFGVMIAGPSTITALLNSLSMGFKTMAINQKANEVWKILGAAKSQYDLFGTLLDKARKKVEEAGRTLETAQNRNRLIQKKLKKVEELDLGESTQLLDLGEAEEDEPF